MGFLRIFAPLALALTFFSAIARANTLSELKSLYPYLDAAAFEAKLKAADTPLAFFRSFVPLHYLRTRQLWSKLPIAGAIKPHPGWCMGDAHYENFGSFLDVTGKAKFSITDLEDAGPCPLPADALHFLVSVLLFDPHADLEAVLKSYRNGLMGDSGKLSQPVAQFLEENEAKGFNPKKNDLTPDRSRFAPDSDLRAVSPKVRESLLKILIAIYGPNVTLRDVVQKVRDHGGSGGLLRFLALLTLHPTKPFVVEFKQIETPGIAPFATEKLPDPAFALRKSMTLLSDAYDEKNYSVKTTGKLTFLIRPRIAANQAIKIDDFTDKDRLKIFRDEAQLLGVVHAQGAASQAQLAAYRSEISNTDLNLWIQSARSIAEAIQRAFQETH